MGHPAKRWTDDIVKQMPKGLGVCAAEDRRIAAANREEWQRMEERLAKVQKQEEESGCL